MGSKIKKKQKSEFVANEMHQTVNRSNKIVSGKEGNCITMKGLIH